MAISCILSFTAISALAQTSTSKVRIRNLGPFQPTKSDVVSTFRLELDPNTEVGDVRLIHNGTEIAVDHKEFSYEGVRFLDLFPKELPSELEDGEHEIIVDLAPKGEKVRTSPRRVRVRKGYTIDRSDSDESTVSTGVVSSFTEPSTISSSIGALQQHNECTKMKLKLVIPYWPNESRSIHKDQEELFRNETFIEARNNFGALIGDPTVLEISDTAIYLDASKFVDFKRKSNSSGAYQGVVWRHNSLSLELANTLLTLLPEIPVVLVSGYFGAEDILGRSNSLYGYISLDVVTNNVATMARVVSHELGHLLGLGHTPNTLMDPGTQGSFPTWVLNDHQRVALLAHACSPHFDPPYNYNQSNLFSTFGAWINPFATPAAPDNSLCGNFVLDEGEACESNVTPMAHNGWMVYSEEIGWHPDFALFDVDANHYSVASFAWHLEDQFTLGVRTPSIYDRDAKFDVCSGTHFLDGVRYDLIPGTEPCTVVEVSKPELNCWDAARGDIEAYMACPQRAKLRVLEQLVVDTFNQLWTIQDACNSWNCPMFMPNEFLNSYGLGHNGFFSLFRWRGVFQLVWQLISDSDLQYLLEMLENRDGDPDSSCGGEDRAMCGAGSCDAGKQCTWIPPRSNTIDGFGWWVPGHCGCRPPEPPEPPEPGPYTPIDGVSQNFGNPNIHVH